MLNLIKYDLIRKYKMVIIALITVIAMNLLMVVRFKEQGVIMFLTIFMIGIPIIYIIDIIKMYGEDLNKTNGYMLFMTANSGYKIILSKVITAIVEGFLILILFSVFFIINGIYLNILMGIDFISIQETINGFNHLLSGTFGFNLGHLVVILFFSLLSMICFILTVYTSMTIRKSIFSEIKLGGVLSFLIFLFLNWFINSSLSRVYDLISPQYNNAFINNNNFTVLNLLSCLLPAITLTVIVCVLMTLCSGYLLEKKINL